MTEQDVLDEFEDSIQPDVIRFVIGEKLEDGAEFIVFIHGLHFRFRSSDRPALE